MPINAIGKLPRLWRNRRHALLLHWAQTSPIRLLRRRISPVSATLPILFAVFLPILAVPRVTSGTSQATQKVSAYLGFDRNVYPGDAAIPILRKTFAFTGYWLSPPPGEKTNTWLGKRELLRSHGFGFLVLYRGRDSHEFKNQAQAERLGSEDGESAAAAAKSEGFSPGTIIFLDIEEGGRLPVTYHAYLHAWFDRLAIRGFRAGVYCSGIPVHEDARTTITTADDIRAQSPPSTFSFWIYDDACPPSPGCAFPVNPPSPASSRREFTPLCAPTYRRDGNCYAPGDSRHSWFLDVNSADSPDPSGGAK